MHIKFLMLQYYLLKSKFNNLMFILTYSCFKYDIHTKFKVRTIPPHSNIIYQISFMLYEFVLRAQWWRRQWQDMLFWIHTLEEDRVHSPRKDK